MRPRPVRRLPLFMYGNDKSSAPVGVSERGSNLVYRECPTLLEDDLVEIVGVEHAVQVFRESAV
jgi:hypothetical protein